MRSNQIHLGTWLLAAITVLVAGCVTTTARTDTSAVDDAGHPVAFRYLPKAKLGYVDWVEALKRGTIQPKDSLVEGAAVAPLLDLNIVFRTSVAFPVPDVVFPHLPHTMWLDCNNCHPALFRMKQGGNPVTMERVLRGEFCGRCHGTVAFPIEDCFRCHSRKKGT